MDSERVVSDALRAQVASGRVVSPTGTRRPAPSPRPFPTGWVLMIAMLVGAVVGVALALISIFVPGALPALGGG